MVSTRVLAAIHVAARTLPLLDGLAREDLALLADVAAGTDDSDDERTEATDTGADFTSFGSDSFRAPTTSGREEKREEA